MATKATWKADEGYSGCMTARKGDLAIVIAGGDGTQACIQVFDEADEEAMAYGETVCRIDGIEDGEAARELAERLFL